MTKFHCTDIDWDVSGTDAKVSELPAEVVIEITIDPDEEGDEEAINDRVVDALSDEVGFCLFGACIERKEETK